MIKKVKLKNFQCFENLEMELHPGFNVIIGESNAGKTALLRALRLLFYNQPRGLYLMRDKSSTLEVQIETTDGHVLRRARASQTNLYEVDGAEFKSFGTKVPEEVIRALGIASSELVKEIYCAGFASQLSGPFLLSLPDSQKGKILASLSDMTGIDQVLSEVRSEARRKGGDIERTQEELEETEQQYASLSWVPTVRSKVKQLEVLLDHISETQTKLEKLRQLQVQYQACSSSLTTHRTRVVKISEALSSLSYLDLERSVSDYTKLFDLKFKFTRLALWLTTTKENLHYQQQSCTKLGRLLIQIQDEHIRFDNLASLREAWLSLSTRVNQLTDQLLSKGRELLEIKAQQTSLVDSLGGVCPTCSQPLGEDALAHLKGEHA